jgi:hypothetical protein
MDVVKKALDLDLIPTKVLPEPLLPNGALATPSP